LRSWDQKSQDHFLDLKDLKIMILDEAKLQILILKAKFQNLVESW